MLGLKMEVPGNAPSPEKVSHHSQPCEDLLFISTNSITCTLSPFLYAFYNGWSNPKSFSLSLSFRERNVIYEMHCRLGMPYAISYFE